MSLEAAYAECARITRQHGPNFSVGFDVLPDDKRRAVQASYAFCRLADDAVDEGDVREDPAALLALWREELECVYEGRARHPVGIALADAVQRYPISRRSFEDLIRGCEQDLDFVRPANLAALEDYCDLVATPIGEMSLAIFGGDRARLAPLARHLAHAFQWTNILRDVREDHERGRVYLPGDWLAAADVAVEDMLRPERSSALETVLRRGIQLTRAHYECARPLADRVDPDARATVRLMTGVYREILERIAADPARVLHERVGLADDEKRSMVEEALRASG